MNSQNQNTNIFGPQSTQQVQGTGLFGNNQQPPVTDQQRQQMQGGGGNLFGNNQSVPVGGSIFSQQPQQPQNSLFPQQQNQNPSNLFGIQPQNQQQPGALQTMNQQVQPQQQPIIPQPSNNLFSQNFQGGGGFQQPQNISLANQNPQQQAVLSQGPQQVQQPGQAVISPGLQQGVQAQQNPILSQPQQLGLFGSNQNQSQPVNTMFQQNLQGQQAQQGSVQNPPQVVAPVIQNQPSSNQWIQQPAQQPSQQQQQQQQLQQQPSQQQAVQQQPIQQPAAQPQTIQQQPPVVTGGLFLNRLSQGNGQQDVSAPSPFFQTQPSSTSLQPQNSQSTVPLQTLPQQIPSQTAPTINQQPIIQPVVTSVQQNPLIPQQGGIKPTIITQTIQPPQQIPSALNQAAGTQTLLQPIKQPVQVQIPYVPIPLPNNNQIITEIQMKDEKALVTVLGQKGVKERLIQCCQFYQINGPKLSGPKKNTFEDDIRTLIFDDCLPQNQVDTVIRCISNEILVRLKKSHTSDKREQFLVKARIPILVTLSMQRVTILHALTSLLEKPCWLEDREVGIVLNTSLELTSFIVNLFQTSVKDGNSPNEPSRNLLEYLVITFQKSEDTLDFYLKGDTQDQYVLWQMYNAVAQEQLGILRIFILVSQYYAGQYDLVGYKKQCFALIKILIACKMQGIANNPKLFRLITHQEHIQSILKLGEMIEQMATIFLLSITKLPGQCDFVLEQGMGDQFNTVIRGQEMSRNVLDKPGFMLFSPEFTNEFIQGLMNICPVWIRMIECLATSFMQAKYSLDQIIPDQNEFMKKCRLMMETTHRENKGYGVQLQTILRIAKYEEEDQSLAYAIKRSLQQWLCLFTIVKNKLCDQSEQMDVLALQKCCEIQGKLLQRNNLFVDQFWNNYAEQLDLDNPLISGDVLLFIGAKNNYLIVPMLTKLISVPEWECRFRYTPLRPALDSVVQCLSADQENGLESQSQWNEQILQPLLKFAVQSNSLNNKSFSQEGMGRRSNASMEYYQTDQSYHSKVQDQKQISQNVITDRAIEDTIQVLAVAKFLKKLSQSDASKLQNAEIQMGMNFLELSYWPIILTILKALCSSTSWCYQALQLTDPRAIPLVTRLFKISGTLLSIINATLDCEVTSERSAYTIGLFGALYNQSVASGNMSIYRAQWHPILEVQDLLGKYDASQLQGVNPESEKSAQKVQIQILKMLKTLLSMANPLDYFPIQNRQQGGFLNFENEIESSVLSLKDQFPGFLGSLLQGQSNFEGESYTQNFPKQFERVLLSIEERKLGIQSQLLKNLLDVLSQIILPNFQRYLDAGTGESFCVLQISLQVVQIMLQRFTRNHYRYTVVQSQLPPLDNPSSQFLRLLGDTLNQINSKFLITRLLSPLDIQIDLSFFDDVGQSSLGTQLRNVGLSNVLWSSVSRPEMQSSTRLKQNVVSLLIETLGTLTHLMRLTGQVYRDTSQYDEAKDIQLVQLMHTLLSSGELYFFRKSDQQENVYSLSLVHGVMACMSINHEGLSTDCRQTQYLREDTAPFRQVYDQFKINDDSRHHNSLMYRGITRSTHYQTDVFCASMRLISTLIMTMDLYGQKENGLENLIIQVMQEKQGQFQALTVKHVLSQFLTSLIKRFFDSSPQQVIDIMEFLIICVDRQQNVLNPILKPSSYNKGDGGVLIFITALGELPEVQAKPLERQHIDMLSVLLLNMLLERENHFSRFAELCRVNQQKIFIKVMSNVLRGLQDPLFSLSAMMVLRDQALTNQLQNVVKHFLTAVDVNDISYSEIFQQLILEYCVVGAITQCTILDYFLKVLLKEIKSEGASEVCTTLLRDFFQVFDQWSSLLISLQSLHNDHQQSLDSINKMLPVDRSLRLEVQVKQRTHQEPLLAQALQINQYGMGRDSLVDTQDLLAILQSWDVGTHEALIVVYGVQRFNLLESLLRSTQSCLVQLQQTIAVTISSGTDGIPISCLGSNNIQYVNAFRPDVLKVVLELFNKQTKYSIQQSKELQKQLLDKFEVSSKLAKSLIQPNSTQILIPKGFISILNRESTKNDKTIEKAYRALLGLLNQVSKAIYDNIANQTPPQTYVSGLNILMELFAGASLLLDYQRPYDMQQQGSHIQEIHANLIRSVDLDNLIQHQMAIWNDLLQTTNEVELVVVQGFCYFICFVSKAITKLEHNDCMRMIKQQQNEIGQMILHTLIQVTVVVQKRNDDSGVYLLAYILTAVLRVYPEIIRSFLLGELDDTKQDATKLMLNRIRGRQQQNFLFQAVMLFWIGVCQDLDMSSYLVKKRNILDILKHHPDFINMKDEQIYLISPDNVASTHNHKHIMWCYTLILVRECSFADSETLKIIWDFVQLYRKRIFSAILTIDNTKTYQNLQQFPLATQLQYNEVTPLQPGLYYLQELQHTIALLTTLIHQPSLKAHLPVEHDKLSYYFTNLVMQQITTIKRTKQIYTFVKPFTLYECKLNQQDLAVDGVDLRQNKNIELSPQSSPNLQSLRQMGVSTPKRLDLMSEHRSLSRANSFQFKPAAVRMDQELLELTPFQLIAMCEFVNIWQIAILGLTSALEQKDISENGRASLQIAFEPNYWLDLGESLVRFIFVNRDLLVNVSKFANTDKLLTYINLVNSNLDYQIQHGGLNLLNRYPANKSQLVYQLVSNIVMGVQAAYQHLQLRELYRELRFIKESFEMEQVFAKKICYVIDQLSQESEIKSFSDPLLNDIFYHELHEAGSYWQAWKDKFDIIVSK